jgi:Skp family chaperone for outer membrane proteins
MNTVKHIVRASAAIALFAGLSQAAFAAPPAPPPAAAPLPMPKILVVDRADVLRRCAAGQSIMKQVQGLATAAEGGLKARDAALRQEGGALQQQLAILSAGVKAAKLKAFETKQRALQADVQKQQGLIQGGLMNAREQVLRAMGPVLQKIVVERGANMLIDRGAIVVSAKGFDITDIAVVRLNQALPTVKVTPTPLPAGAAPQQ